MLPEGWRLSALGKIAQVTSGGTPDRSEPKYWAGDIPWVTTGEIRFNTIFDTTEKITSEGLASSSAKLFPAGTLLMAMYGQGKTRGQVAQLGVQASTNQACAAIVLKASHDSRFYFHVLSSRYSALRELGNAGTQKNLNGGIIKQVAVPVPPAAEQRAIASLLDIWDGAISITERLFANSWRQRQALLGALLHTPVLPSQVEERERKGGIPPSVQTGIPKLSATPKGWQLIKLGDHLHEVARPIALQPEQCYDLVTVKRSRGGVCLRGRSRGDEIKTPTQFLVEAGDFLISKRQIVHGACGIVPPELAGAIVSNEYAVLNADGSIDMRFLRYLSESIYFQQTCYHSSIGVHVEKMIFKTERWLSFLFNIPPLDRQLEIVRVLDAASAAVESCAMQMQSLQQEKTALMQQLLTGKRRVHVPDPAEETESA